MVPRMSPTTVNRIAVLRNESARSPAISIQRTAKKMARTKNAGNVLDTMSAWRVEPSIGFGLLSPGLCDELAMWATVAF